jgi:hypothetical protein
MLVLGAVVLVAVVLGTILAIRLAGAHGRDEVPASQPSDFVAPASSGGFAWRTVDETPEQFRERLARDQALTDGAARR